MTIDLATKWDLIRHHRVSPIEYDHGWTLRDLMEAMTAKAFYEDNMILSENARRERLDRMRASRKGGG